MRLYELFSTLMYLQPTFFAISMRYSKLHSGSPYTVRPNSVFSELVIVMVIAISTHLIDNFYANMYVCVLSTINACKVLAKYVDAMISVT